MAVISIRPSRNLSVIPAFIVTNASFTVPCLLYRVAKFRIQSFKFGKNLHKQIMNNFSSWLSIIFLCNFVARSECVEVSNGKSRRNVNLNLHDEDSLSKKILDTQQSDVSEVLKTVYGKLEYNRLTQIYFWFKNFE